MKIYDISMEIKEDMLTFFDKVENRPVFDTFKTHEMGATCESRITLNSHTGTHMDAPLHMVKDGANLSSINLYDLVCEVCVYDLVFVEGEITKEDILKVAPNIKKDDFVIFKTKNSFNNTDKFDMEYTALGLSAAEHLSSIGIKGIAIDSLSVGRGTDNIKTHQSLLTNGIIVIEGVCLKEVKPSNYEMIALPLKIKTLEGVPMRVILRDKC